MSIVGPRPALPREVEQYGEYEKQRLYVTPGLQNLHTLNCKHPETFQSLCYLLSVF